MAKAASTSKKTETQKKTATSTDETPVAEKAAQTAETAAKSAEEAGHQAETVAREMQETVIESTEALREQVASMFNPAFDYGQAMTFASANLDACMKANEAWFQGVAEINKEIASFAHSRMNAAGEVARSLGDSNGNANFAEASFDIARRASEDYAAEASKLMSLSSETMRACWSPLQTCWRANGKKAA